LWFYFGEDNAFWGYGSQTPSAVENPDGGLAAVG